MRSWTDNHEPRPLSPPPADDDPLASTYALGLALRDRLGRPCGGALMSDETRTIRAELEADADPAAPLCPICRAVLTREIPCDPPFRQDGSWFCLNAAEHGGQPNTAAVWRDWELDESYSVTYARLMEMHVVVDRGQFVEMRMVLTDEEAARRLHRVRP